MAVNMSKEYAESILKNGKILHYHISFTYKGMRHSVSIFEHNGRGGKPYYVLFHADDNFLRFISLAGAFDSAEEALQYIAKQEGVEEFVV